MIGFSPRRLDRNRVFTLAALGVAITAVGIILAFYGFPKFVSHQIRERIVLKEGSESYGVWKEMPFPLSFKVYIFNVTNPEEVTNGSRPNLQQIGPYVYREYRKKENVHFNGSDRISYTLKKIFFFDQEQSMNAQESDLVTVLNVAMLGMILSVNKMMPSMLPRLDEVLPQLFNNPTDPFLRSTVADFLFNGIFINCSSEEMMIGLICHGMKSRLPITMRPTDIPEEGYNFSMFTHLNNSATGPFTIDTGEEDLSRLGQTLSYKNSSDISAWEDDCSILNGTDSTIFPPIDHNNIPKSIHIFQPDICRTMYAEYKGRGLVQGLAAYRYEAGRTVMESFNTNPDNKCYCPSDWSVTGSGCALDGLQSLQQCQGAPVLASFPHFYLASPALAEYVNSGIHPDKIKHQTFVEIEPKTGVVLRGAKRMQFNMELARLPGISVLADVRTGVFPVLWVEEGGDLNIHVKKLLDGVYLKIKLLKVAQWFIVAAGVVLVLAALGLRGAARARAPSPPRLPGTGDESRPRAAQKDGRFYSFNNPAFSADESVAHK